MKASVILLLALLAAAAGCAQPDQELMEKLSQRTHWLRDRVLLLDEKVKQAEERYSRLQTRYIDLDTRHKRLDLEFKLIQNRLKPMRDLGDRDELEEKMFRLVTQLPAASDEEWPDLKKKIVELGSLVVPALLQAYKEGHIARASQALLDIRDPSALPTLVSALEVSKTRLIAAEALEKLGQKEAVEHLAPYLTNEDLSVRVQVASALGALGDMSGIPVLIDALDHPDYTRRWLANSVLVRVAGTDAGGFKAEDNKDKRQPAIARWRSWWRKNKERFDLVKDLDAERAARPDGAETPEPGGEEPGEPPGPDGTPGGEESPGPDGTPGDGEPGPDETPGPGG